MYWKISCSLKNRNFIKMMPNFRQFPHVATFELFSTTTSNLYYDNKLLRRFISTHGIQMYSMVKIFCEFIFKLLRERLTAIWKRNIKILIRNSSLFIPKCCETFCNIQKHYHLHKIVIVPQINSDFCKQHFRISKNVEKHLVLVYFDKIHVFQSSRHLAMSNKNVVLSYYLVDARSLGLRISMKKSVRTTNNIRFLVFPTLKWLFYFVIMKRISEMPLFFCTTTQHWVTTVQYFFFIGGPLDQSRECLQTL